MKSILTGVALLSVLGLSMTGCTSLPSNGGTEQVKTLPFMESPNPTMNFEDESNNPVELSEDGWRELSNESIELTLHGSSSCPPAVEKVTKKASTVTVELKPVETFMACTEDLGSFYVTVAGTGKVETVEIASKNGDVTQLPKMMQLSTKVEALTDTPITADPSAKLTNSNVVVGTTAAPLPEPEPIPEPVAPAPVAKAPVQKTMPVSPSAPAQKKVVPVAPTPVAPVAKAPVAAPVTSGNAWIQATMAKYGVYPAAGTQFVIGPMPAGCIGADGCTEFYETPEGVGYDYVITIRPGQLTEYLLIHEIAHARGIRNECAADNFARSYLGPVPGHYC